jgi:hypothetical protein
MNCLENEIMQRVPIHTSTFDGIGAPKLTRQLVTSSYLWIANPPRPSGPI